MTEIDTVASMAEKSWLARYQAGERGQVWHELRQLGASVREERYAADAQAVCDEMARRARRNIDTLVERLHNQGYRFFNEPEDTLPTVPHVPPTPEVEEHLRQLESLVGPVPMALASWMRLVGDVCLVGSHPDWETSAAGDPLVFEVELSRYPGADFQDSVQSELEVWEYEPNGNPFAFPVAPDRLHKDSVSGGPPYGVIVSDQTAEGIFVGEVAMPLVSYLNLVFQHGGFPHHTGGGESGWRVRRSLAQDLLEL